MSNEAQPGDSQSQSAVVSPFLYRDFCVFWTGSFLSGIGTQFTTVAMAWQIYELHDLASPGGLLGVARAAAGVLYAAPMLLALFTALKQPSRQSMVPNLVPRAHLAQALALQGTQRYVPIIAGPSLAGVVLAMFGPAACYTVDALSWLAMMTSLALLRTKIPEGGGWKT